MVENLQIYKANHIPTLKQKGMALVSSKYEGGESNHGTESNYENEDLEALIAKKLKKILNKNKGDMKRSFLKNKAQNMNSYVPKLDRLNGKSPLKNSSKGIQCFECQ